ncbi:hypothetical protein JMJ35_004386 [Cladonia borealis]|uniref:Uncharacterized protein n=1 Tax=Cladonia borealis TaxID=184061 RepID=A0AA39R243_9LECA|nr:hypothetical protein JMJ35_004386 [Cladonia borealis]
MQYQIVVPPMMAQVSPSPTINPFAPLTRQENPICGYISANVSRPVSCEIPNRCASSSSYHGCCTATTACFFPSSCIESTTCNEACNSNSAILTW